MHPQRPFCFLNAGKGKDEGQQEQGKEQQQEQEMRGAGKRNRLGSRLAIGVFVKTVVDERNQGLDGLRAFRSRRAEVQLHARPGGQHH